MHWTGIDYTEGTNKRQKVEIWSTWKVKRSVKTKDWVLFKTEQVSLPHLKVF